MKLRKKILCYLGGPAAVSGVLLRGQEERQSPRHNIATWGPEPSSSGQTLEIRKEETDSPLEPPLGRQSLL